MYNKNTQPCRSHKVFNNWDVLTKGWYITIRGNELKSKQAKSIAIGKQKIVLYRGQSGKVYAVDAFCPHIGADLGLGSVKGEHIQCIFHNWEFSADDGMCKKIPCGEQVPKNIKLNYYSTEEKYGFIWVWPDVKSRHPIHSIKGLSNDDFIYKVGKPYKRSCHYHITMINGLDAQHLNNVHDLPVSMSVSISEPKEGYFKGIMSGVFITKNLKSKYISWLLGGKYTYSMLYTDATIGFLTMMQNVRLFGRYKMPELHLIYAYTPMPNNSTIVTPIYVTQKNRTLFGRIKQNFLLFMTKRLFYRLKDEDGLIYENIQFNTDSLLKIDLPIAKYINYINNLDSSKWSIVK